jgi:hypothetical protein
VTSGRISRRVLRSPTSAKAYQVSKNVTSTRSRSSLLLIFDSIIAARRDLRLTNVGTASESSQRCVSNFVGRTDYLAELEAVFVEGHRSGSRPVGVLCGLSGIGKTQISAKFAETRCHL